MDGKLRRASRTGRQTHTLSTAIIVVEFHPTITSAEVITDTILHLVAEGFVLNLAHSAGHVIAFDRRSDAPK